MRLDDLGKMCDNDRYRIDERVTEKFCLYLLLLAYPLRLDAESRFNGLDSVDDIFLFRRCKTEIVVYQNIALGHFLALNADGILVRIDPGAVL